MKIQIRRGTFETNSSSVHSIVVSDNIEDNTLVKCNYQLAITCGEYGWGFDILDTPEEKLSYLMTELSCDNIEDNETYQKIQSVVKKHTGFNFIFEPDSCGYIDHQSRGLCHSILNSNDDNVILDFIFNRKNVIVIDNDNH